MNETLVQKAKLKCYIEKEQDGELLDRLTMLLEDAQIEVAHLIGVEEDFDFSKPSLARELFLNFVWYAWNDAKDEFEHNYLSDIMKCSAYYGIQGAADNET